MPDRPRQPWCPAPRSLQTADDDGRESGAESNHLPPVVPTVFMQNA